MGMTPHVGRALAVLLGVATLGEGGAQPTTLLLWHVGLVCVVLGVLSLPDRCALPGALPAAPLAGFGLFVALSTIGAARAPYGYAAWLFLVELGAFAAVAWLAAGCGPRTVEWLRLPLLVAAVAQSSVFLVQRIVLGEVRPAGTMLNPNHLAGWLLAVLFLVAGGPWSASGRDHTARWVPIALVPVALAFALIGSRGALLGLVAGGAVVAYGRWASWSRRARRVAVAAAVVAAVFIGAGLVTRLRQFDPFRYQRIGIWRAALAVSIDHPWFGSGPRQFAFLARNHQFPDGDGPLGHDRGFRTTHSDWLRLPVELGWPAALVLAATLVAAGRAARRPTGGDTRGGVGAIAALAALAMQAGVENLSARPAVQLLAAVLLGSVIAVERRAVGCSVPRAARLSLALVLATATVVGEVAPYLAWRAARGALHDSVAPDGELRLAQAIRRNPVHPDYWRRLSASLASAGSPWNDRAYAAAREAAERAVRLNPSASEGLRQLGRIEARACTTLYPDAATRRRTERAYLAAEAVDRFNPFIPLELAGFLLDADDPAGAGDAARRALAIEPEAVRPRLLLAAATLRSGTPAARQEAAAWLAEARDRAARWSERATDSEYARELLTLDPRDAARIERALAAARSER